MMFIASLLAASAVPAAFAAIHDIQVGAGGLVFDPPAIGAQAGDQVVFHFHPKAHSVTQSSFADPCGPKAGGFDSQLIPVPDNQTDQFPTWTLTVNDTTPTWAYCKAAAGTPNFHCGQGMVFAINCGPDGSQNSFTHFHEAALQVGASLSAAAAAQPSATPSGSGSGNPAPSSAAPTDAPYPDPVAATATVTLGQSTWTTTYQSYPNSPDPTPASAEGVEHKVIVGGPGKLAFDPERITAKPRDTIVFEFHQKNHTATQSSFAAPCLKKDGGLDSGFFPVADSATEFPTWKLVVNDTAPLWFFCAQGTHCSAGGMVFAVNTDETPSSPRNLAAFKEAAMSGGSGSPASGSAPPSQPSNGAVSTRVSGVVVGLLVVAVAAFL